MLSGKVFSPKGADFYLPALHDNKSVKAMSAEDAEAIVLMNREDPERLNQAIRALWMPVPTESITDHGGTPYTSLYKARREQLGSVELPCSTEDGSKCNFVLPVKTLRRVFNALKTKDFKSVVDDETKLVEAKSPLLPCQISKGCPDGCVCALTEQAIKNAKSARPNTELPTVDPKKPYDPLVKHQPPLTHKLQSDLVAAILLHTKPHYNIVAIEVCQSLHDALIADDPDKMIESLSRGFSTSKEHVKDVPDHLYHHCQYWHMVWVPPAVSSGNGVWRVDCVFKLHEMCRWERKRVYYTVGDLALLYNAGKCLQLFFKRIIYLREDDSTLDPLISRLITAAYKMDKYALVPLMVESEFEQIDWMVDNGHAFDDGSMTHTKFAWGELLSVCYRHKNSNYADAALPMLGRMLGRPSEGQKNAGIILGSIMMEVLEDLIIPHDNVVAYRQLFSNLTIEPEKMRPYIIPGHGCKSLFMPDCVKAACERFGLRAVQFEAKLVRLAIRTSKGYCLRALICDHSPLGDQSWGVHRPIPGDVPPGIKWEMRWNYMFVGHFSIAIEREAKEASPVMTDTYNQIKDEVLDKLSVLESLRDHKADKVKEELIEAERYKEMQEAYKQTDEYKQEQLLKNQEARAKEKANKANKKAELERKEQERKDKLAADKRAKEQADADHCIDSGIKYGQIHWDAGERKDARERLGKANKKHFAKASEAAKQRSKDKRAEWDAIEAAERAEREPSLELHTAAPPDRLERPACQGPLS